MRLSRLVGPALALLLGTACEEKHSAPATPAASAPVAPPPSASASAAPEPKKLPAAIAAAKKLRVGSDITYAPIEFYKPGTKEVQGFDVDLCDAIAKRLGDGITCEFQAGQFDKLLGDLAAHKYDLVMSAMTDDAERQTKADFIDYFRAGMSVIIKKGNPLKLGSVDDLCGRSVGAQKGTTEETFAHRQKTSCINAGKPALTIVNVATDGESLAQLKAGRLAADLEDLPAASYSVKTAGGGNDFELLGEPSGRSPYGIAVAKDNAELRSAVLRALKEAIADGTYDQLIEKWSLGDGALKTATINGG